MSDDTVPSGTFGDYGALITNADATANVRREEICQRSGFRVEPGTLVKDWEGLWVLPKFRDYRHPQEKQYAVSERGGEQSRPELDNVFINQTDVLVTGDGFYISTGLTGDNLLTGAANIVRASDL